MRDESTLGINEISDCCSDEPTMPSREPATMEDIRDPYFVSDRPEDLPAYMALIAQSGYKR